MHENETYEAGPLTGSLVTAAPLSSGVTLFLFVPIVTTLLWYAVSYFTSPLRKYPGPFLGGESRIPGHGIQPRKFVNGARSHSMDQLLPHVVCLQGQYSRGQQGAA